MKFFSEHEVRKLIEETDIHDGIRGTADDYLPFMKGIELPDNYGRLIDAEEAIAHWDAEMMVIDKYSMRQFLNRIPTVLEASNG